MDDSVVVREKKILLFGVGAGFVLLAAGILFAKTFFVSKSTPQAFDLPTVDISPTPSRRTYTVGDQFQFEIPDHHVVIDKYNSAEGNARGIGLELGVEVGDRVIGARDPFTIDVLEYEAMCDDKVCTQKDYDKELLAQLKQHGCVEPEVKQIGTWATHYCYIPQAYTEQHVYGFVHWPWFVVIDATQSDLAEEFIGTWKSLK